MKHDFEIGIIGGGPAGAAAALYLNKAGYEVCVFEKKNFPREILCGEFLSHEVFTALKDLGLAEKFLSLKPNVINSFKLINNNGNELSTQLNFTAYALPRSQFDHFLFNAAEENEAAVFQPCEVKFVSREKNYFKLEAVDEKRQIQQYSVKYLIAAYGKQNILDKKLNRKFVYKNSGLNGVKFHLSKNYLKNFNQHQICIYAGKGIYCGVNAVCDDLVTLCFLEDRNAVSYAPRQQILKLAESNPGFAALFQPDFFDVLDNLKLYGTGNIYFGKRELVKDGIFMIGDSAGVIAPLAGDGIGMAIQSAALLSEVFKLKKNSVRSHPDLQKIYSYRWNKNFRRRLYTAKMIQQIFLNDFYRNAAIKAAAGFPALVKYLVQATRSGEKK